MDIQNTFSDIRNCFLDIQNNYFGYPKTGINVNSACHKDELVVLVAQGLERKQVNSRVGAFPEFFGMADSRSEGTESRSKPGIGWMHTVDRCCNPEWR